MKRWLKFLLTLVIAAAIGLALRHWCFGLVRISGSSMSNTLENGDWTLVTRSIKTPQLGDVIECTFPGRSGHYIKRVIGLPGDWIQFTEGMLYVNGQAISEPYVSSPTSDLSVQLGEDEYFVLGDNRAESYDSRNEDMGCIGAEDFLGYVRAIVWPPERIGFID